MADGRGVEAGFCVDILRIRSFVTVARLGNVTRASEALHVTQPAVTGHIKTMEQELGVALFQRSPGRIELTRAGAALLPDAEKVLAEQVELDRVAILRRDERDAAIAASRKRLIELELELVTERTKLTTLLDAGDRDAEVAAAEDKHA